MSADLPLYRSHKLVRAAPIASIDGDMLTLDLGDGGTRTVRAEPGMFARYLPAPGDVYVIYPPTATNPRPYASISPREAFEEGYSRVREAVSSELDEAIAALPGEKVTAEAMEARIVSTRFLGPIDTLTLCVLTLDNGISVVGQSACVDPANYRQEIGERLARDDAFRRLWPLFGFLLAEARFRRAAG